MVFPSPWGVALIFLIGMMVSPVQAQGESAIGLPQTPDSSAGAFARWQQINQAREAAPPQEPPFDFHLKVDPAVEEAQVESQWDRIINVMDALPVQMDYTGVGLVYERDY